MPDRTTPPTNTSTPKPVPPPARPKTAAGATAPKPATPAPKPAAAAGSGKSGGGKADKVQKVKDTVKRAVKGRGKAIAATAAGVVAAAAGVATVKALRGRKGGGKLRVYHVKPKGEDWQVRLDGAERAGSLHATKKEAIAAGRELAQKHEPSRLVIHGGDGSVQRTHSYGEDD